MSRAQRVLKKRLTKPDFFYHSPLVARMVNKVMQRGKKSVAEKIVFSCLEELAADKTQALEILKKAMENVTPKMEVRARRVGGATYQVPGPVRHDRAESLAIRWLLAGAKARKGLPMHGKLAQELKDAASGLGAAVKRRETMHKMAEANRAFAHFRW